MKISFALTRWQRARLSIYALVTLLLVLALRIETWIWLTGVFGVSLPLAAHTEYDSGIHWRIETASLEEKNLHIRDLDVDIRLRPIGQWYSGALVGTVTSSHACIVVPAMKLELPPERILEQVREIAEEVADELYNFTALTVRVPELVISRNSCTSDDALRLALDIKLHRHDQQMRMLVAVTGDVDGSIAASVSPAQDSWLALEAEFNVAHMASFATAGALELPADASVGLALSGRSMGAVGYSAELITDVKSANPAWGMTLAPTTRVAFDAANATWALHHSKAVAVVDGNEFTLGDLLIGVKDESLKNTRFALPGISELNQLNRLFAAQDWLPEKVTEWPKNIDAHAIWDGVYGAWDGGTGIQAFSAVKDVCFQNHRVVPALCNGSGRIVLDWPYLQVDASSDRLELDIANAFDTPWELDDASTELLVDFSNLEVIDLWLVGIDATDKAGKVAADIRFQILPFDLVTFVDVWLTANDMDMALVSPFMPILPAVKPITEILRESLRGGIAKRFELTLAANTGPGIQELGMRTAPGVALLSSAERVEFVMPGWVGLQEGNALLSVTPERSQIWATGRVSQHYKGRCTPPATQCPSLRGDGMKIEVLTARARDFPEELQGDYPSYLKINGSVKGDFYTLTNTLGRFDALEGAEGFFIDGVFSGPIRGDLTIAFGIPAETLPPLGANAFRDVFELEVVGHLDQGSISLPDIPIHVSNISGNFHFDLENGFWSEEIKGSFLGGDFVATLDSDTHLHDPDIISSIAIDGVLDVTHLSPWLGTVASELSQGNARWVGVMEFPLLGGTSPVEFEVTSDLAGIKFDLPEPLNKAADEQLRIDLAMVLETWEAPIDLSVLLGELQANLRIEEFDMHGRVNLGAASFDMPTHVPTQNYGGIEIFARLESGELLEWLDISTRISEIGEATPGPAKVPVRYLNANIAMGTTMGLVVEDIDIEMVADPGRDNLTINAMAPSGASVTDRVLDVHGTLPASDQEPLVGEAWMKSIDVSDIELTDRSSEFSYIDATWRIDDLRYRQAGN